MHRRLSIDPVAFGRILREVRLSRNMTEQDLADAMTPIWRREDPNRPAISLAWVRRAERGEMASLAKERLAIAAEALAVPLSRLMPPQEAPPTSRVDLVVYLRGYGVPNDAIDRLVATIDAAKSAGTSTTPNPPNLGDPADQAPARTTHPSDDTSTPTTSREPVPPNDGPQTS